MAISTEAFEYSDGSTLLRGQLARDNTATTHGQIRAREC